MEIAAPHPQVLPFFPQYSIESMVESAITNYRESENCVGHQQRAMMTWVMLTAFVESGGIPGIDLGSAGVQHLGCLSVDIVGTGEVPHYGGKMDGVHLKADAGNLFMLGDDSFSCVISNHTVEHLLCDKLVGSVTPEQRIQFGCPGYEVANILRKHWIRIVRPGGLVLIIAPDQKAASDAGSSVFLQDPGHRHAFSAESFYENVIESLLDVVEVVNMPQFDNQFSWFYLLKKK